MAVQFKPSASVLGYAALVLILTAGTAQGLAGSNTVDIDDIQDGTVRSVDIKDENLKSVDIKDGGVTGADLADSTVTGTDIAYGTIKGADVFNDSLTGVDISNLSSGDVVDGGLEGRDIKDNTVTGKQIDESSLAVPGARYYFDDDTGNFCHGTSLCTKGSLPLPAGTYAIFAKIDLNGHTAGDLGSGHLRPECMLIAGADTDTSRVWHKDSVFDQISLEVMHTFNTAGSAVVKCTDFASWFDDTRGVRGKDLKIIAIKIGTILPPS